MTGWIEADWPLAGKLLAGSTTRSGGVSAGPYRSLNLAAHVGDDAENVAVNRERLVSALGVDREPRWLRQVHGARVLRLGPYREELRIADAAVTSEPEVICAVLTADCLPVLLAAEDASEVAAVHAGWRGLAAGVLEAAVAALETPPGRLLAWLGPGIGAAAYEVGDEVREALTAGDADAAGAFERNAGGRWQADLYAIARRRLTRCGVSALHGGGFCTHTDPARFFSHRRDGTCGRMATLVCRLPGQRESGDR